MISLYAEIRVRLLARAVTIAAALVAGACTTPTNSIDWPTPLAPSKAELFSHNEVVIDRPCQQVWRVLVAAPQWPQWYDNASDVRLLGTPSDTLESDSTFTWTTFGIAVRSRVREFEPAARLAWLGAAEGMTAYHAWLLRPLPNGCRVITEETNNGPAAVALRRAKPEAIHDGHAIWLARLKAVSEK